MHLFAYFSFCGGISLRLRICLVAISALIFFVAMRQMAKIFVFVDCEFSKTTSEFTTTEPYVICVFQLSVCVIHSVCFCVVYFACGRQQMQNNIQF